MYKNKIPHTNTLKASVYTEKAHCLKLIIIIYSVCDYTNMAIVGSLPTNKAALHLTCDQELLKNETAPIT